MSYSEDGEQQMMAQEPGPGSDDDQAPAKQKGLDKFKTKIKKDTAYSFPIGQNASGKRIVQISKFKGKVRIDIREYYQDDDEEWKPTKKGLSLDVKQWEKLQGLIPLINEAVNELE